MRFWVFLAVFVGLAAGSAGAASSGFDVWLKQFREEAVSRGISRALVERALPDTFTPIERVLELDRKQPEKTKTFDEYLTQTITDRRVATGRERMAESRALLNKVSAAYGVEPEVIVALWGVETSFGKNTGGYSVVEALATLAYDGRRGAYFREELFKALKIVDENHISLDRMKGSWAGAMGQIQFMPTSFYRFAEDFNGDGHRDIWTTEADVFASAARYLSESGWKKGQPWGRRVKLPAMIERDLLGADKKQRSLQFWHDAGVRLLNGKSIPFEGVLHGSIIQPGGPGTSAFLIYDNYRIILLWNRSNYFATSVGLLADRLKGS